jgi:SAM-dependent methyltransferase
VEPTEYDRIAALEERHWWYTGMRAGARALLRRTLASSPPNTGRSILDAGCGTGGGLRWLAEFGRVTGLDVHPLAVRHAVRVGPRVCRASVLTLPFAACRFDLVTCFDVLYHRAVADDEQALREFARVLQPGGFLLLRVPAHDWLRGAHDAQVYTRQRYARAELREKVGRAGLVVRRLTYAGAILLPPALLRRSLQRGAVTAHSDVDMPPAPINTVLTAALRLESIWLSRWDVPFGLSLLVLAQKPATT